MQNMQNNMQTPKINMQNMQNNMQTPKSICRIVHCPYSAYLTYICTPHFADARPEQRTPKGVTEPFTFSLRICMDHELVLTPLCVPLFEAGHDRGRHRHMHNVKINYVVPDVGIRYSNIRTSGPI